jgi:hypothetical protein
MMNILRLKIPAIATTLFAALLIAEPADAFRCGNKLIKDGMHEAQVGCRPLKSSQLQITAI